MRAVDTNVLVRLLTGDDPRQAAAAEAFIEGGAWISHLALAETTWVLGSLYERTPAQIAQAVGLVLDHTELTVQDPDLVKAALEMFRSARGVTFSDCLLLESARRAGHLPLGTLDRHLGKLDGAERL